MAAAMIGLLSAVAFGSCAEAEQKFQKLTGAQIQAKFAGMELREGGCEKRNPAQMVRTIKLSYVQD